MKCMTTIFALAVSAILLASCADTHPPAGIPAELRTIMEVNRAIALPSLYPDFGEIVQPVARKIMPTGTSRHKTPESHTFFLCGWIFLGKMEQALGNGQ